MFFCYLFSFIFTSILTMKSFNYSGAVFSQLLESVLYFCTRAYPVLLPPSGSLYKIFLSIRSLISLSAVSGEHFVIFAHLELVSLPSDPSSNLFNTSLCLLMICQIISAIFAVFTLIIHRISWPGHISSSLGFSCLSGANHLNRKK